MPIREASSGIAVDDDFDLHQSFQEGSNKTTPSDGSDSDESLNLSNISLSLGSPLGKDVLSF